MSVVMERFDDRALRAMGRREGQLRPPIHTDTGVVCVGASVGIAIGARPLIPSVLSADADRALYQAKRAGKNSVCLATNTT